MTEEIKSCLSEKNQNEVSSCKMTMVFKINLIQVSAVMNGSSHNYKG